MAERETQNKPWRPLPASAWRDLGFVLSGDVEDRTLIKTGVAGAVVAAICCFTPVLVVSLGFLGLSAWLGWLDYILIPALILFLAIAAFGLWRRRRRAACCAVDVHQQE